ERRHTVGPGLLSGGGASRGNLFSGGADHLILTVSRMEAERRANPGYRAFLANGFNVARSLVLCGWEVILEWSAAARERRRDVRPRGHRGGMYPFLRAAVCVIARDLIVYGVLTDMMKGRPAIYATFSSYDEVAHHSGLEREDTLEALRKLDQQFARIERARRYAARPYALVVLSDHGQTQGATFRQRNGYGLDELVRRNLDHGGVSVLEGGDELDARHPQLLPALRSHPHVGWVLVGSGENGAVVLGSGGARYLEEGRAEGEDPLAGFPPTAPQHLLRTHRFAHAPDVLVGSFYDPALDEGCAFEELISFHGGLGGSQTRPFVLYPAQLPAPEQPLVGAEALHRVPAD